MEFDISAFEALFKLNYSALCLTAMRIVGDKDVAEDIVQDTFLKIWHKRESLHIDISLKAYLHKSVLNNALNQYKKSQADIRREENYSSETHEDVNYTEQLLFAKDIKNKIDLVINALPEGCRRIFILSRFEDMSYKQIAESLNISVKTVEHQMSKALKFLRNHLAIIILIFLLSQ